MRTLVTAKQMKAVDAHTIHTIGIPSMVLMERAAQAKEALALFEQEKLDRIAAAMLEAARERLSQLARLSAEETG